MPSNKTVTVDELFSRRLREIREQQGVTQVELARRMAAQGTPIDRLTILKIERAGRPEAKGKSRRVSIEEALAFAFALNTSPLAFLLPADPSDEVQIGDQRLNHEVLIGWLSGGAELSEETAEMEQELVRLERNLIEARKKYTQFMQAAEVLPFTQLQAELKERLDEEREVPRGKRGRKTN
jgi:transcriptional regulator with XRE-family HTH domain